MRAASVRTLHGISIHTAPKGGDDFGDGSYLRYDYISIHTAPKGGDEIIREFKEAQHISIHTAPKGGDKPGKSRKHIDMDFNPHRP